MSETIFTRRLGKDGWYVVEDRIADGLDELTIHAGPFRGDDPRLQEALERAEAEDARRVEIPPVGPVPGDEIDARAANGEAWSNQPTVHDSAAAVLTLIRQVEGDPSLPTDAAIDVIEGALMGTERRGYERWLADERAKYEDLSGHHVMMATSLASEYARGRDDGRREYAEMHERVMRQRGELARFNRVEDRMWRELERAQWYRSLAESAMREGLAECERLRAGYEHACSSEMALASVGWSLFHRAIWAEDLAEQALSTGLAAVAAERARHRDDVADWLCWLALTGPQYGDDHVRLDIGNSAANAVRIALGGDDEGYRPYDCWDWGRCRRLLETAPESVGPSLRATFRSWWAEGYRKGAEGIEIECRVLDEAGKERVT